MIKTIHYSCGCIVSFKQDAEGKVTGHDEYNFLCDKHNLSVGYDK